MKRTLRFVTWLTLVIALIFLCYQAGNVVGGLLTFLFVFWPLIVNVILASNAKRKATLIVLWGCFLLFCGWSIYAFVDIMYWYPDPQSPISLIFVGIYAFPYLILPWGVAIYIEKVSAKRKGSKDDGVASTYIVDK